LNPAVHQFPARFRIEEIKANGTTLHVRIGGNGHAAVLLHGFGETGDMWVPAAARLAQDHIVVVPDLRGMGLSAHAETGYTKKNQGIDIKDMLDYLKIEKVDLVTHDIGNHVGYGFAAQYPGRVTRWIAMESIIPGLGDWDTIIRAPRLWHFNFRGPDVERLVAGRERIYLDRFWNESSADPKTIDEATRQHYAALYARPHAMHDAFEQFAAFAQDAIDNREHLAKSGKLLMPVLAVGGEKSYGKMIGEQFRFAASNVTDAVIGGSGHWIMDEKPAESTRLIVDFLSK
jgi:pimeloyl-ACP methyl ester carboxylesterase